MYHLQNYKKIWYCWH